MSLPSLIAWANKTQSTTYDPTKWNAQDANELKEKLNQLIQHVSTLGTGTPNTAPSVALAVSTQTPTVGGNLLCTITASDSDGTVTGVVVKRGGTFLGNATRQGTTNTYLYTWVNVPAGGPYSLTAEATDNSGATNSSSAVSVTPGSAATAPAAVTQLDATAGNTQAVLTWEAPAANGAAISNYKVEYKQSSASTWTNFGSTGNLTIPVTGLSNGVSYDFRVTAQNSVGYGPVGTVVSATPQALVSQTGLYVDVVGDSLNDKTFIVPSVPARTETALSGPTYARWTNLAVQGSKLEQISQQIDTLIANAPADKTKWVVVHEGLINNVLQGDTPAQALAKLYANVAKLYDAGCRKIIVDGVTSATGDRADSTPPISDADLKAWIKGVNDGLRADVRSKPGVIAFLDTATDYRLGAASAANNTSFFYDKTHYTAEGAARKATMFYIPALQRVAQGETGFTITGETDPGTVVQTAFSQDTTGLTRLDQNGSGISNTVGSWDSGDGGGNLGLDGGTYTFSGDNGAAFRVTGNYSELVLKAARLTNGVGFKVVNVATGEILARGTTKATTGSNQASSVVMRVTLPAGQNTVDFISEEAGYFNRDAIYYAAGSVAGVDQSVDGYTARTGASSQVTRTGSWESSNAPGNYAAGTGYYSNTAGNRITLVDTFQRIKLMLYKLPNGGSYKIFADGGASPIYSGTCKADTDQPQIIDWDSLAQLSQAGHNIILEVVGDGYVLFDSWYIK